LKYYKGFIKKASEAFIFLCDLKPITIVLNVVTELILLYYILAVRVDVARRAITCLKMAIHTHFLPLKVFVNFYGLS